MTAQNKNEEITTFITHAQICVYLDFGPKKDEVSEQFRIIINKKQCI